MYKTHGGITPYQLMALTLAFVCGSLLRGGGIVGAAVILFWMIRSVWFANGTLRGKGDSVVGAISRGAGAAGAFPAVTFCISLAACTVIAVYDLAWDMSGLYSGVPVWLFAVGIAALCAFALFGNMTIVGRGAELTLFVIVIGAICGAVTHVVSSVPIGAQLGGIDTLGATGAVINLVCLTVLPTDGDASPGYASSGVKPGIMLSAAIGSVLGTVVYLMLCLLDCGIAGILLIWIFKIIRLYIIVISLRDMAFPASANFSVSRAAATFVCLAAFGTALILGSETAVCAVAIISATAGISAVCAITLPKKIITLVSKKRARQ